MRVGLVCPYSWDVPGGVQEHVRDLAETLIGPRPRGLGDRPGGRRRPRCPPTSCRPAGRCRCPTTARSRRLAFGFLSASRVRRWLREGEFDVLHVHEPAAPSLSLLAAWSADGPIVATFHTANPRSRAPARGHADPADGAGEDQRPDRGVRGGPDHAGRAPGRRRGADPQRGDRAPVREGRPAARLAGPGRRARLPRPDRRAAQGPGRAAGARSRSSARSGRGCGCWSPGPATPTRRWRRCRRRCATGWCCSGRSARRTRPGCTTRSTCTARRTPAARASASCWSRRWPRAPRSWPATWTRSARVLAAGGPASCSPPGTRTRWRRPRPGCWTTRRGGPSCPRRPAARSAPTTGPRWPARWSRSTRRWPARRRVPVAA